MFKDTKGVIRRRKSKDREHNDVQNTTWKTKARSLRTPLKPGSELVGSACFTCGTRRVTNPVDSHE